MQIVFFLCNAYMFLICVVHATCYLFFTFAPPEIFDHVYDVNSSHMLHFCSSGLPRLFRPPGVDPGAPSMNPYFLLIYKPCFVFSFCEVLCFGTTVLQHAVFSHTFCDFRFIVARRRSASFGVARCCPPAPLVFLCFLVRFLVSRMSSFADRTFSFVIRTCSSFVVHMLPRSTVGC